MGTAKTLEQFGEIRAWNYLEPGAQGSPKLSGNSLKFLQGTQRCIVLYTQHFYEACEDAVRLPGKYLNFKPWEIVLNKAYLGRYLKGIILLSSKIMSVDRLYFELDAWD